MWNKLNFFGIFSLSHSSNWTCQMWVYVCDLNIHKKAKVFLRLEHFLSNVAGAAAAAVEATLRRGGLIYGTFENSSIALDSFASFFFFFLIVFLRLLSKCVGRELKRTFVVVEEIHRFPIARRRELKGKAFNTIWWWY